MMYNIAIKGGNCQNVYVLRGKRYIPYYKDYAHDFNIYNIYVYNTIINTVEKLLKNQLTM